MAEGLNRQRVGEYTKAVHAKDMSRYAPTIVSGATEIQPPTDMFYGANSASVRDPFGHVCLPATSATRRVVRQSQNLKAAK